MRAQARRGHQDAIDAALLERTDHHEFTFRESLRGGEDDGVAMLIGDLFDAAHHFAVKWIGNGSNHHPYRLGTSGDQAAGDGAGRIAMLFGDGFDALSRGGRD